MQIRPATLDDAPSLAALLWRFSEHYETDAAGLRDFTADLLRWWETHRVTHLAFLAIQSSGSAVGMAWLAIMARAPRPGNMTRMCGDVQSVYVLPEYRDSRVGSTLVATVLRYADDVRLEHVTVHANDRALPLYKRAGFTADGQLLIRGPLIER